MQCLDIIQFLLWHGEVSLNPRFSLFITERTVFYPLLGYYLENQLNKESYTWKKLVMLASISFVAIVVCCALTHYNWRILNMGDENSSQTFLNAFTFIPAATVFYAVKFWFLKHPPDSRVSEIISLLGSLTFGVYLFEQIYRHATVKIFDFLQSYLHSLPACLIWILVACTAGFAATWIMKHIPFIGKLL